MQIYDSPTRRAVAALTLVLAVLLAFSSAARAQDPADPQKERIARLIEQLGDPSYVVREEAQEQLTEMGFAAYEMLEEASEHADLEIAARAKYVLRTIRLQWTQQSDSPEVKEQLEDYELQTPEGRLERIRHLARLSGGQGIEPLCRLVRFEGSELLSKYAAIEILGSRPVDREGQARWAKTLRENLPRPSRPAARWLASYLQLQDQPQETLAAWARLAEDEQFLLGRTPPETTSKIIIALLYYLAEAEAAQGQSAKAEKTATKARSLNPGNDPAMLYAHWEFGESLRQRGLFNWAEAEYQHVIDVGTPDFQVLAHSRLAEMRHDRTDHLGAAKTLNQMLDIESEQLQPVLGRMSQTDAQIRARMNYFYACHWEAKEDRVKQQEHLDEAIKHDPGEIDVLIARFRLPDTTPEYGEETSRLIAEAATELKQAADASPEEPSGHNQFAWLVGNTEGDSDAALKAAHKAVELSPTSGAYYDTLAHVYAGRGDYRGAVKYQTRAVELEPHSGLIIRQLKRFRAELERSQEKAEPDEGGAKPAAQETP